MKGLFPLLVGAASLVVTGCLAACGVERPSESWRPPLALPRSEPLREERLVFNSDRSGNFELFAMGTDGSDARQLTSDSRYDSWGARLSPDRRTIVFSRAPAGVHDRDPTKTSLWAVGSDGSGGVELRPKGLDGWGLLGHPEWAPDGNALVMVGGSRVNAQIFTTDAMGQQARSVTGERPGTNIDPSFTPDGRSIVFVGCPQAFCTPSSYEIYSIPVDGGAAERLTTDRLPDFDPVYSPDGSQLAWLTNISGGTSGVWDVRIRDASGKIRRLIEDTGITSRPNYAADGTAIFMHRKAPDADRFSIYSVAPDGRNSTNLTPATAANDEYPSP